MTRSDNPLNEKFRPTDQIDKEVDEALAGISLDDLYGQAQSQGPQQPQQAPGGGAGDGKGPRRGRVVSVDAAKDEVFVDFGGKSQGVAPLSQFDEEPKVGQEIECNVERYDPVAPSRTRLRYSYSFRRPDDRVANDAVIGASSQVTAEDIAICESVQRNLEGGTYDTGWLSPRHEAGVAAFQRWVREAVDS